MGALMKQQTETVLMMVPTQIGEKSASDNEKETESMNDTFQPIMQKDSLQKSHKAPMKKDARPTPKPTA